MACTDKENTDGHLKNNPAALEGICSENNQVHESSSDSAVTPPTASQARLVISLIVLTAASLLFSVDKYTVSGILKLLKDYFHIGDKEAGLLGTVLTIGYVLSSPLYGYFGDRYSRKFGIAFAVTLGAVLNVLGSFSKENEFWIFFAIRGCLGIAEAGITILAPAILSDLFVGDARTKAIAVYSLAIPLGSGLGVALSAIVAAVAQNWQWALRVTPPVGLLLALLCLFVVKDPKRGESEAASTRNMSTSVVKNRSSYMDDLKYIFRVKSYIAVITAVSLTFFTVGTLSFWGPTYLYYSQKFAGRNIPTSYTSAMYGAVIAVAGIIGIFAGATISRKYRRHEPSADGLVACFFALLATPCLFFCILTASDHIVVCGIFLVLATFCILATTVATTDLTMYIIVPIRRATALAILNLMIHILGDASSPFVIGAISDAIRKGDNSASAQHYSIMYASFLPTILLAIAALLYLICSWYIPEDRKRAEALTRGIFERAHGSPIISVVGNTSDVLEDETSEKKALLSEESQREKYGSTHVVS